jgi:hypothetical protein
MNSQIRPDRLFRYFPPDASDFFSAKKLWFSTLKDLNDPFDALPRFDVLIESERQHSIKMEHAFLNFLKIRIERLHAFTSVFAQ